MADLDTRFRELDRVQGPDLWSDIESRQPRPMPDGGVGRRVTAATVALVLAAGGAVLVTRAFLGGEPATKRPVRPAESPPGPVTPVVDVTLPIKWPYSIVYGEGRIWVAVSANDGTGAGTVYRIDPDTAEILAEIVVPSVPGWEVGGGGMEVADGSLWIAGYLDEGDQGALLRIDAATNALADVVPLGGQFAGDVAVDEHGIWLTVFSEPSVELVRVKRAPLLVDLRTSLDVDWAREIVSVDGQVWVRTTQGALSKVDPQTGDVVQRVDVPGGLTSLTTFEGAIWGATWKASEGNLLARIDAATGEVLLLPAETLGFLVESGPSGLWGRWDPGTRGTLGIARFDPATGRVDASVALEGGNQPVAMAVAPGSVWVTGYKQGVTRVELRPA
jgi:outer membrane protein assembly factor BamB